MARRRAARELAVLVLLDASSSTDAWVEGRRVLDVERDAATIVGLATDGLLDELGLAAFFSDTHADCRYVELKRFDEPWPVGLGRLAGLAPAGYTRIGPALRHGTTALARCRATRRVLLVLTDGKPGDRDRYEGRHGEADVRQALREANRAGVEVLALGADPRAAAHLGAMFGPRSIAGLSRPEDVAKAIAEICTRRMRR
jgi:nitric oxide reductase NorD protein